MFVLIVLSCITTCMAYELCRYNITSTIPFFYAEGIVLKLMIRCSLFMSNAAIGEQLQLGSYGDIQRQDQCFHSGSNSLIRKY
jgi:hypothetical protein